MLVQVLLIVLGIPFGAALVLLRGRGARHQAIRRLLLIAVRRAEPWSRSCCPDIWNQTWPASSASDAAPTFFSTA